MYFRKSLLALASVLCVCSLTSAQDLVLQTQTDGLFAQVSNTRGVTVSSLPSDIFGESSSGSLVSTDHEVEQAAVNRANMLVLMGIGGLLVAGLAGAGLFFALQKKNEMASRQMQLVI